MFRRLSAVLTWPFRVWEHRRVLAQLGEMDDRSLADIGLTRQDLRDVTALPRGADPTRSLSRRAAEREFLSKRARRSPPSRVAAE